MTGKELLLGRPLAGAEQDSKKLLLRVSSLQEPDFRRQRKKRGVVFKKFIGAADPDRSAVQK